MKNWLNPLGRMLYVWAALVIILLPFPYYLLGFQEKIAPFLFAAPIKWAMKKWTGATDGPPVFSSDAPGLYYLLLLFVVLATGFTFILYRTALLRKKWPAIRHTIRLMATYYLALQLLKYGFDKVFKAQFYLPEPNTLYTPVGQLDKDILFWTTMGTSWSYNVFLGVMELLPALLLLFRRTRVLGYLLSAAVLLQVVAINYSFGITVKVFSTFLLFLAVLGIAPYLPALYRFFIRWETTSLPRPIGIIDWNIPGLVRTSMKTALIGLLFLEALYPYLQRWHFNDDTLPRPALHGAYEVTSITSATSGDTLVQPWPEKRFFIHRRGYFIFQHTDDSMQDYKLQVFPTSLQLTNYDLKTITLPYTYDTGDSTLSLQYRFRGELYWLSGKALDWRALPVLR